MLGLALFAVGGQLAGVVHLALVPHTVCAEHGELVHAEQGASVHAGGADATSANAAHVATTAAYRAGHAAESADHHEHCFVSALRRQSSAVAPAQASPQLAPLAGCQATTLLTAATAPAIPLLALAPKSSPPALLA
jgi:hypothetical protein